MTRFAPDLIIALGGGSPLDAAKAMWLFYEDTSVSFNDLRLNFVDIRKRIVRFQELGRKARMIAIPTTSKAIPVVALSVHGEARVLIVVERAVPPAAGGELHILPNEVVEIYLLQPPDQSSCFAMHSRFFAT